MDSQGAVFPESRSFHPHLSAARDPMLRSPLGEGCGGCHVGHAGGHGREVVGNWDRVDRSAGVGRCCER